GTCNKYFHGTSSEFVVESQICSSHFMPVFEHARKFGFNRPAEQRCAQEINRQRVLDTVHQGALIGTVRLYFVRMVPVCERSTDLLVGKLNSFYVIAMLCNPIELKRTERHSEDGSLSSFWT